MSRITRTICDKCKDEQSARPFEIDLNRTRTFDDEYHYYSGDLCILCRSEISQEVKKLATKFGLGD